MWNARLKMFLAFSCFKFQVLLKNFHFKFLKKSSRSFSFVVEHSFVATLEKAQLITFGAKLTWIAFTKLFNVTVILKCKWLYSKRSLLSNIVLLLRQKCFKSQQYFFQNEKLHLKTFHQKVFPKFVGFEKYEADGLNIF